MTTNKDIRIDVFDSNGRIDRMWIDTVEDAVSLITTRYGKPTGHRFSQSFSEGFSHRNGIDTTIVMQRLHDEYEAARVGAR